MNGRKTASWDITSISLSEVADLTKSTPATLDEAAAMRNHFRHSLSHTFPTRHLLGINTFHLDEAAKSIRYSSALLVQDDGTATHRFDKVHRVPFGEYVPLRDWLPFMSNVFAPYDSDYSISPGQKMTRFPIRGLHFGVLVCFEDSDPYLARQYAQTTTDGKPVDFLVNMSNDGWFHGTSEHDEHLVISRFRAIENRRALVRSVNMGISAVIDPNGRVQKPQVVQPDAPDPDHLSGNPRSWPALRKTWDAAQNLLWTNVKKWETIRPSDAIKTWEVLSQSRGQGSR